MNDRSLPGKPLSRCTAVHCGRSSQCGRHAASGTLPAPFRQVYQDYSRVFWFDPDHCYGWMAVAEFKRRAE